MMNNTNEKTLRLLFPQWQGGNNAPYYFGAQLLAWLAPEHNGTKAEVQVEQPTNEPLKLENGIMGRSVLLQQALQAQTLIETHQPDKIIVLGGDCLVDLTPFAYLNEKYQDDLAVLWVDAHPDVMTPNEFQHAHAMVLGNLLGQGDADFTSFVKSPLKPSHVMYAGVHDLSSFENEFVQKFSIKNATAEELGKSTDTILNWFKSTGAKHLAIHLDLDVLDAMQFRSLLFAEPNIPENTYDGVAQGKMSIELVIKVLNDIAQIADVVGIGIAEHLPWDALALKNMLAKLPLIGAANPNSFDENTNALSIQHRK